MIVIKGKYSDMGTHCFNIKNAEKVSIWFKREFESGYEDDDEGLDEIVESIKSKNPNMVLISDWLWRKDCIIEKWHELI